MRGYQIWYKIYMTFVMTNYYIYIKKKNENHGKSLKKYSVSFDQHKITRCE